MACITDGDDPLVMPLLEHVLLERYQGRHDAVLVDGTEGQIIVDLIVLMLTRQLLFVILRESRNILAVNSLAGTLEQEPIRPVAGRVHN